LFSYLITNIIIITMKKLYILIVFVLISLQTVYSQQLLFLNQSSDSVIHQNPLNSATQFVPGEILIKFRDDISLNVTYKDNKAKTGIITIDMILAKYNVYNAEKLYPNEKQQKTKVLLKTHNGETITKPSLHNVYRLKSGMQTNLFQLLSELNSDTSLIEYAEPNYLFSIIEDKALSPELSEMEMQHYLQTNIHKTQIPQLAPTLLSTATVNDPLYSQQWYIPAVYANQAWDSVNGKDTNQIIAILDSGVDWLHPDLMNKIWTNANEIGGNGIDDDANGYIDDVRGWDWINNDNNPTDDNSHGTHVAGIAAAQSNNGIGISGVSQGAKIMALKIIQSSGQGDAANITQGILYAAQMGATVLNMSFGSYVRSMTMENALANAYASCVLVAAAGNDGKTINTIPFFPASLSYVMGVQAPDGSFSNTDDDGPTYSKYSELHNYEFKAPGTQILSTIPNGNYRIYQGTSMAAPVMAGAVAICKSLMPGISQEILWTKLIQSTTTYVNVNNALVNNPTPQLWFVSKTLIDTISNGDGDERVDAGETIQLWFKMRNSGGYADSVNVGIRFGEFEDTTTAQIIIPQAYVGNMSAYANLTNSGLPLKIHINSNVANNRSIVFQAYTWYKNSPDTVFQNIILTVEKGEELLGILSDTLVLTSDKLWLLNGSFKMTTTGVLILKPGTHLQCRATLFNDGQIFCEGTADSMVNITCYGARIQGVTATGGLFLNHTNLSIDALYSIVYQYGYMDNSMVSLTTYGMEYCGVFTFDNSVFRSMGSTMGNNGYTYNRCTMENVGFSNYPTTFNYCNFIRSSTRNTDTYLKCNFLDNKENTSFATNTGYYWYLPNQYWGTTDSVKISKKVWDFFDDALLAELIYWPYITVPSDSAQAFVWKILVNSKDAQDEYVDPVGVGVHRFDVYFNKEMDINYTPQLSFGVREPYNQQSVSDSGHWDATHRIWTAYITIQLYTGDGINRIKVQGAKGIGDLWEIPIENQRFEFIINAAGSASVDFMATPGIGKINLEWNNAGIEDLMGFNMYRFQNTSDTTFSEPILINTELITDTLYTDFNVLPNTHYYYYYKILRTDFAESDSSHIVNGIPLNASQGDANGDLNVNVLDITSIISYMLNQNPQPFIFEAADVNNSLSIDVLDLIGVVNLIIGTKSTINDVVSTHPLPAYIYLKPDRIQFKSDTQVAGIQFTLKGNNLKDVKLSSLIAGFELAYSTTDTSINGILFSFTGNTITAGMQDIIKIEAGNALLNWDNATAGSLNGEYVTIIKEGEIENQIIDYDLKAYPNPGNGQITISFNLTEKASISIQIYNLFGQLIKTFENVSTVNGLNKLSWNTDKSGIYICRLQATTAFTGNNIFTKDIKLIVIK
jgi:subtilisin family serine protease